MKAVHVPHVRLAGDVTQSVFNNDRNTKPNKFGDIRNDRHYQYVIHGKCSILVAAMAVVVNDVELDIFISSTQV